MSDTVVIPLTEYIIFDLHGDKDTTTSSINPSVADTCVRSFAVAVAVNANILTALGTRLQTSLVRSITLLNVSPLY